MGLTIFQVDAFAERPFAGNPAGVCILPEPRDDNWMQNVAREMNLSETAFLQRRGDGFNLRWFTPAVEVDLCGHATLASAHILWEQGVLNSQDHARFHTRSGLLTAQRQGEWIELDFPALPDKRIKIPRGLPKALGTKPRYVGRSRFDCIVEVGSEKTVRGLRPDFTRLSALPIRGLIVTAKATTKPYDFVSRFFAPRTGINEDPVTGSAHCVLGPFWSGRLGKNKLLGYQASARGGIVRVRVGDKRVYIGGKAVTVLQAELRE
ncbi:MAG: PhzF family phenazine biosynthesis protein [Candidatus Bathyarchaeia archaeon]